MDTLGERIRYIRTQSGLTQQEFGRLIGVSQAFLSMVEHGKETPSTPIIRLISMIFEVDEKWIFLGTAQKSPK